MNEERRNERLRAALDVRAVHGTTELAVEVVEDVDGVPLYVEEAVEQTVVFVPGAFGVTAEEVEVAALIEAAGIEEES